MLTIFHFRSISNVYFITKIKRHNVCGKKVQNITINTNCGLQIFSATTVKPFVLIVKQLIKLSANKIKYTFKHNHTHTKSHSLWYCPPFSDQHSHHADHYPLALVCWKTVVVFCTCASHQSPLKFDCTPTKVVYFCLLSTDCWEQMVHPQKGRLYVWCLLFPNSIHCCLGLEGKLDHLVKKVVFKKVNAAFLLLFAAKIDS